MEGIAQTPPGPFQVGEDAKNYDACIRKFGPGPWDVALYPPLPVETFGLGAIFADFPALRSESNTLSRDSAIRTYSTNIMVHICLLLLAEQSQCTFGMPPYDHDSGTAWTRFSIRMASCIMEPGPYHPTKI